VNEKYTRWVKTQPCACCGKPADDPHHLIGHGQGGMGTKSHDIFTLPLCREHHNDDEDRPLAYHNTHTAVSLPSVCISHLPSGDV
ncbi:DUF968 domain-containing protein, partial [Escherichia coli]|uniref:DUF968 domain-containing protein n=1 Tax=Escherichia coli TaxID=562 RepID=UPI003D9A184B